MVPLTTAIMPSLLALASPTDGLGAPDFQYDPVEYWAARILGWAVVVALGVVVYALVRAHRGTLSGPAGKGILLVGVVLLPSFSVATGMLLVLSRAGRVEFCGSCHGAMSAFVSDMTDTASDGLAALHHRHRYIPSNQCYECHTSYGLFGGFEAKLHGIGEVMRYYSGSYDSPIRMWRPYPNADCLKCHAQSEKWGAVEMHVAEGMKNELFSNATSCMSCHAPGHRVDAGLVGAGT